MTAPIANAAIPEIPVFGARPPDPAVAETPAARANAPNEPTFEDFLRGLNPLHHLPVVGMIYRAATGETIAPAQRIAGAMVTGALLGGPAGVLGTALLIVAQGLLELEPDPSCPSFSDPESGAKNMAAIAASSGDTGRQGSG